jgi:hypothetical protein
MKCTEIVYIYCVYMSHIFNQKSEIVDFKGPAEVYEVIMTS